MTQAVPRAAEVTAMITPLLRSHRWKSSAGPWLGGASRLRQETRPPSLRLAPPTFWGRLWFWLMAPAPHEVAPPPNRLGAVRDDFLAALFDVPPDADADLRRRIERSHSLRDLWHLRAEVYHLVGVHGSQAEAEQRLARLNRHFPARAPRSGFTPLS